MNIYHGLLEEIAEELDHLKGMTVGSDEYKTTVDGITKLYDRATNIAKMEYERKDRLAAQKKEHDLKRKSFKLDIVDCFIKHAVSAIGIGVPALITIWGVIVSLDFEKTGVITTVVGRGFLNKLTKK